MKLLKVPNDIYEKYKDTVKGNENTSLDQVRRKLTRNMLLAKEVTPRSKWERLIGNKIYHYGNLHFVVRYGKVIELKNYKGGKHYGGWRLDEKKRMELTIKLGIEDSKF